MINAYYKLTKPGIVYGNAIAGIAGFFLGSRWNFNLSTFIGMLIGECLIMASACVFNCYIDRNIDKKMQRTKNRPLASGEISPLSALIYGTILGIIGIAVLAWTTNLLTVFLGIIGFIFYVIIYGIAKRGSVHGTIVGSISGSIPLVAGYTAVTNRFDMGAVLLFIILALWQMPHFYSLAMYRVDDYKEAGIPVVPVKLGMNATKKQILWYVVAFAISASLLTFFHYTGYIYLVVMAAISIWWIIKAVQGLKTSGNKVWGRGMFLFSLKVLLAFCLMIAIGGILP